MAITLIRLLVEQLYRIFSIFGAFALNLLLNMWQR